MDDKKIAFDAGVDTGRAAIGLKPVKDEVKEEYVKSVTYTNRPDSIFEGHVRAVQWRGDNIEELVKLLHFHKFHGNNQLRGTCVLFPAVSSIPLKEGDWLVYNPLIRHQGKFIIAEDENFNSHYMKQPNDHENKTSTAKSKEAADLSRMSAVIASLKARNLALSTQSFERQQAIDTLNYNGKKFLKKIKKLKRKKKEDESYYTDQIVEKNKVIEQLTAVITGLKTSESGQKVEIHALKERLKVFESRPEVLKEAYSHTDVGYSNPNRGLHIGRSYILNDQVNIHKCEAKS